MHAAQELLDLNDQIAALQDYGLSPGLGLGTNAPERRSNLEQLSRAIRESRTADTSLNEVISEQQGAWPPNYFWLVSKGSQCTRLSQPLEQLVEFQDDLKCARERLTMAVVYPGLVCIVASLGLLVVSRSTIPSLWSSYQNLEVPRSPAMNLVYGLSQHVGWIIGALVAALVGLWYVTRSLGFGTRLLQFVCPAATSIESDLQWAEIAALARVLVEGGSDPQSAVSSAQHLVKDGSSLVKVPPGPAKTSTGSSRPFLNWALAAGHQQKEASEYLALTARTYRDLAAMRSEALANRLSLLACVLIGGTATLSLGLAVFLPFSELLQGLARP